MLQYELDVYHIEQPCRTVTVRAMTVTGYAVKHFQCAWWNADKSVRVIIQLMNAELPRAYGGNGPTGGSTI